MSSYVIITPARNEEAYIEQTIKSVISQTILPKKWVIVSDGSTDDTDTIVSKYEMNFNFIEFVKIAGNHKRKFSSKVNAFNAGYNRLKSIEYDFIGNLDADVSFEPFYYECILDKFNHNKRLGLAGGARYDLCNGQFIKVIRSLNSVSGAYQLFRRPCFEDIGGYRPLFAGVDTVAENMARMHGWEIQSFPELTLYHYRLVGTATFGLMQSKFVGGINDYLIGYHPLFQIFRGVYRMFQKPMFVSLLRICGYFWAVLNQYKKSVSNDYIKYLRSEQLSRLRAILFKGKDLIPKG